MLSEVSQTEKNKYWMVSFICEIFQKGELIGREKWKSICLGVGKREKSWSKGIGSQL